MNEVGKKIIFGDLQIRRGNRQKRVKIELGKNLAIFKTLLDDNEFYDTFDYIFKNKSTRSYIDANLFPQNMNTFARYKEVEFCNMVEYELRWHLKTFSVYQEIINLILKKKMIIDELILLNKYEKALEFLNNFEVQYGSSYWLLENKIFLWNKLELDVQEKIVEKAETSVLTTILSFYNMRSSNEVSSNDYDYFTKREIVKFKRINPDAKKIITFYHFMVAPFSFEMDDENFVYILEYIHNLSLIDRYLCIADLFKYILIESKNVEYQQVLNKYIFLLDKIKDPSIDVFRFMLDTNENRINKYNIVDSLMPIKNKYIAGDVEECFHDIVKYIEENSSNIEAINLYIDICQLLCKDPEEIKVSDNVKKIIKNLNSIYSIDDNYNNSIDEIYKLCFSCIHSVWSRDIYYYINRRCLPYKSELQNIAVIYSNLQKLTIETVCENLKQYDAINFINTLKSTDNIYIEFWKDFIMGNYKSAANKCGLSAIKTLLNLMDNKDFSEFKKELLESNDIVPVYKIRYSKIMWNNMTFETYIEEGIDYFLHLFIQREDFAVIAPMQKFMDYFELTESADKSNLRVPILYYIYTTYFNSNKRDDLSIVCEDFFYYNKIEKPSQMGTFDDKYAKEELIFFLRYVCIPQIMGPVLLSIRSSKDLDQERINTCQYLRLLDPENEEVYEQEIRDITHKLFINEGLNSIENSKIHVNTEGIKSIISKNLKSAFNNYMFYRNHKIDAILETIKNIEGGENVQILTLEASQIFNEIINTIRNEFVSGGEYGLDGYLSLNIRHGTLSAQLRAPLAKNNLLTTYMIDSDSFDVNEKWLFKISLSSDKEKIKTAIIEFNKETDEIIEYLRKTLIQISTEEKPSSGVFDYSLNEINMNYLRTLLTENCEFEEFIDKIFDYLWAITERNLKDMKNIIRDKIKQMYIDSFAKLFAVIKSINEKYSFPEALRWLNEAQNDIDAELEKICNWFKRSAESQHADFDLDLAFQIGFKMIENIHPEKSFAVRDLNKDLAFKIPGKFLKNYWDIFYTLFDNVSEYALEEDGVKYISCDLKVDSTGTFIRMINSYDCSNGIGLEEVKVKKALSLISGVAYLARAKQEGGSGIPKIYKILSVDLDKKADVKCDFLPERNQFTIEIEGKNK